MTGMMLCSIVLGLGIGLVSTLSPMVISETFSGEEQSTVLGLSTGTTSLGGMLMMALGGYLGANDWRLLFWVFLFGVPVFLTILLCLPKDEIAKGKRVSSKQPKTSFIHLLRSLNPYTIFVYLAVFILVLAINAYMANLSLVIVEKKMGDTATTGFINAIGSLGGIVAGFGFSLIRRFTKPHTLALGLVGLSLSLLITFFARSTVFMGLSGILWGIAMVSVMASSPFLLSMLSKPEQIPVVMSIFAVINGLAGALAPKIMSMFGVATGTPSILFGALISLIAGAILLMSRFGYRAENGLLLQNNGN
ncbi:MFS transporter [Streptococcus ovuberis]|uniref:MFS transporter n=1 Tax=Streptococcus ovuberis TaxID=1936207 RepID=A0A7X6MY45_9STRE|nr:MFS transporter [Streptococcus ovuberis]NKZ19913.1 MFS transporter [Streptococcus ovuberis]